MLALFEPDNLMSTLRVVGYVGIAFIVFAESGLFFGFFLPGDSLLATAGILAADGVFHMPLLLVIIVVAAITGDSVGYWFGNYYGKRLFTKKSSRLFNPDHLTRAHLFYEKHGPKAIVLARFVPVVRTFVPIIAGVASMPYANFIRYNIIGALVWGVGVTSLGYALGKRVANIDEYLMPIILTIIVISFLPIVFELIRANRNKKK